MPKRAAPSSDSVQRDTAAPRGPSNPAEQPASPARSSIAKVSHTLDAGLARRLEEFAFFQRVSESSVIEHALSEFFGQGTDDSVLGEALRRNGAGRRRRT